MLRRPRFGQLKQQRQDCWWPCCHAAIYRVDGTNGKVQWTADWGYATHPQSGWPSTYLLSPNIQFAQNHCVTCLDSDSDHIYAGGMRASMSADPVDIATSKIPMGDPAKSPFGVKKLTAGGSEVWRADVGDHVFAIKKIPGWGILVGHMPSFYIRDNILITSTLGISFPPPTSNNSDHKLLNPYVHGHRNNQLDDLWSPSANGDDFTVSGVGTTTLRYSFNNLYSKGAGLRPMVHIFGGSSVDRTNTPYLFGYLHECQSAANLTLLSDDDGSIVWRTFVGSLDTTDWGSYIFLPPCGGFATVGDLVAVQSVPKPGESTSCVLVDSSGNVSRGFGIGRGTALVGGTFFGYQAQIVLGLNSPGLTQSASGIYKRELADTSNYKTIMQRFDGASGTWDQTTTVNVTSGGGAAASPLADATGVWTGANHYGTDGKPDGSKLGNNGVFTAGGGVGGLYTNSCVLNDGAIVGVPYQRGLQGFNYDSVGRPYGCTNAWGSSGSTRSFRWGRVLRDPSDSKSYVKSILIACCPAGDHDVVVAGTRNYPTE